MRTSYSLKNTITAIVSNIITFLVAFIAQAVFVKILGAEYLGLNGLFGNIMTMLSIFELGIGNAIVYNMYKPIAENDERKINSLMLFYKKAYHLIAILILAFGCLLIPFLDFMVVKINININVYLTYLLYLCSAVVSYLMIYKRNLIIAYQRNYITNVIHMIYLVLLNFLQLIVLFVSSNFYLYLIIKIICQIIENLAITIIANRLFPQINIKNAVNLEKTTEKDIYSRVKALIFHKIGTVIINGTDNIIISHFLGLVSVGLYSNYYTIINAIKTIFSQVILSLVPSVGNLLATENKEKIFDIFKKIRFLNFWIACFSSICLINIIQPFIILWVGKDYLISVSVVFVLVFNYFQKIMRNTYSIFKDAAGIWIEDKYVPLLESFLNIIFSILFLKLFGLAGVFMGTIVSGLVLWCYSYPKFIYKKLFDKTYLNYTKETLGYILLFIGMELITYYLSTFIVADNIYIRLIINVFTSLLVPNLIMYILFKNTENFKYYIRLIKNIKKRKKLIK